LDAKAIFIALALAAIAPLTIWLSRKAIGRMFTREGIFRGKWGASYQAVDGNDISETITLWSLFSIVWGSSECTWKEKNGIDQGKDKSARFKIRGIYRSSCLMGLYIPSKSYEHDMGVFIVRLTMGRPPATAKGLITNFESEQSAESAPTASRQALKSCPYSWTREQKAKAS